MDHFLGPGMADADAHAAIILAAMRVDRPQPVVAAIAAADLDPHLGLREVDLVVEHGDRRQWQLVEAHGFADRLAGQNS